MARPKKNTSNRKTKVIAFRVTQSDYLLASNKAETFGLSIADYIRKKITGKSLPKIKVTPLDRKLFVELSRIGNNLNQLTRIVNLGMRDPLSINSQLTEVQNILQYLKTKIAHNDR